MAYRQSRQKKDAAAELASLRQRVEQLETVLQVSIATAWLSKTELLQTVVDLTKERFKLYHVHIYLLDEAAQSLRLVAWAGKVGRQMMAQEWVIPLQTEQSLVATVARTAEPVIVNDVSKSEIFFRNPLLPETQAELAVPMIFSPDSEAKQVLGVLDIQAARVGQFTQDDIDIQMALAAQIAMTVQQANMYEQTRQQAAQMEKLAQIQTALSQATSEVEILAVIVSMVQMAPLAFALLQYLDTEGEETPYIEQTMAIWHDGQAHELSSEEALAYQFAPLPPAWLTPQQLIFCPDLQAEEPTPKITEPIQQQLLELGAQAYTVLPLHSRGSWQGVVMFGWAKPYHLTGEERFVLDKLLEPLAAVVATQRANTLQQQTLEIMQMLHQSGRTINAASDLQQLLHGVVEIIDLPIMNRALIMALAPEAVHEDDLLTVVANWHSGEGMAATPIGSSHLGAMFSSLEFLSTVEPSFFADIQAEVYDPVWAYMLKRRHIRSMVVLPLWVGSRQLGILLLQAESPYQFTHHDRQICLSVAPQVAVAFENLVLLDEAQKRAQRERVLQEITARVRRATDVETVLRTAAREVGLALGRRSFIKLKPPPQTEGDT